MIESFWNDDNTRSDKSRRGSGNGPKKLVLPLQPIGADGNKTEREREGQQGALLFFQGTSLLDLLVDERWKKKSSFRVLCQEVCLQDSRFSLMPTQSVERDNKNNL